MVKRSIFLGPGGCQANSLFNHKANTAGRTVDSVLFAFQKLSTGYQQGVTRREFRHFFRAAPVLNDLRGSSAGRLPSLWAGGQAPAQADSLLVGLSSGGFGKSYRISFCEWVCQGKKQATENFFVFLSIPVFLSLGSFDRFWGKKSVQSTTVDSSEGHSGGPREHQSAGSAWSSARCSKSAAGRHRPGRGCARARRRGETAPAESSERRGDRWGRWS